MPQPRGEARFVHFAGRDGEHGKHAGSIVCNKLVAIQPKKEFYGDEGSPFVSIHERMVSGDPESIGSIQTHSVISPTLAIPPAALS